MRWRETADTGADMVSFAFMYIYNGMKTEILPQKFIKDAEHFCFVAQMLKYNNENIRT